MRVLAVAQQNGSVGKTTTIWGAPEKRVQAQSDFA